MKPGALPAFDAKTGDLNVVIETPKGSRNKFSYDEETGFFTLSKLLPAGMAFPFSFGFIPSTRGGDGDPLDVLVVFDELLFPGCVVPARLIGALKAQQSEEWKMRRNDRLFAVPVLPQEYSPPRSIRDLDKHLLSEIQEFFTTYQRLMGKKFKVLGVLGPKEAEKLVRRSEEK
ncbi:MAG TPA: inorganic diphosphatase [Verrucomicrobiae bacterium]|jgi:inorganic pyrophosphatase